MADIAAVVNLDASSAKPSDGPGWSVGVELPLFSWRAMVASASPALAALFHVVMAEHGVLGLPLTAYLATAVNGGMDRTDGKWFHEAGVPVAWPVAGYPEYHTDGDDMDAVDAADLENVAEGAADVIRRAATLPIERVAGAATLPDPGPAKPGVCAAVGEVAVPGGAPVPDASVAGGRATGHACDALTRFTPSLLVSVTADPTHSTVSTWASRSASSRRA